MKSAFPVSYHVSSHKEGMTLREYFAGQALIGVVAANEYTDQFNWRHRDAALEAVQYADELLRALRIEE